MTPEEAQQLAREQLARNTDACVTPELSTADLDALLAGASVATIWQPDTVYPAGAIVVADALSNMAYRAVQGGTTGSTAPSWPAYPYGSWSGNPAMLYSCCCSGWATITDGGVIWQSIGPIEGLWNIDSASAEGWLLKASRAVTLIQQSSAGQAYAMQMVFIHCRQMARDWSPVNAA